MKAGAATRSCACLNGARERCGTTCTSTLAEGPEPGASTFAWQLGSDRYVLEHTRIDPFEDAVTIGIKFSQFVNPHRGTYLSGVLPGPAYHTLVLPQDLNLGGKSRKQIAAIQEALVDWVLGEAPRLYDLATTSRLSQSQASTEGEFPGLLPYPASLSCSRVEPRGPARTSGRFSVARAPDDDLEQQRLETPPPGACGEMPQAAALQGPRSAYGSRPGVRGHPAFQFRFRSRGVEPGRRGNGWICPTRFT